MFKIRTILIILILLTVCVRHNFLFSLENHTEVQLKPPWELRKLSSALYEFLISPDREEFVKTHHLFYQEEKLRVYVVVDPAISQKEKETLVNTHRINVEKVSQNLLRALVPGDELASLAKEPLVLSIRLPNRSAIQWDN
ncbi:MAG: hypothetical protein ABSB22_17450 [Thermodesulfobacteriota bacterium]